MFADTHFAIGLSQCAFFFFFGGGGGLHIS